MKKPKEKDEKPDEKKKKKKKKKKTQAQNKKNNSSKASETPKKKSDKTLQSLAKQKIVRKKSLFINAFKKSFKIYEACQKAGFTRQTFYTYYNGDEKFRNEIDNINEEYLDFVEGQSKQLIVERDRKHIEYVLSTKGKSRGYTKETTVNVKTVGVNIIEPPDETNIDDKVANGDDLTDI